jgi:hypothetical protein
MVHVIFCKKKLIGAGPGFYTGKSWEFAGWG